MMDYMLECYFPWTCSDEVELDLLFLYLISDNIYADRTIKRQWAWNFVIIFSIIRYWYHILRISDIEYHMDNNSNRWCHNIIWILFQLFNISKEPGHMIYVDQHISNYSRPLSFHRPVPTAGGICLPLVPTFFHPHQETPLIPWSPDKAIISLCFPSPRHHFIRLISTWIWRPPHMNIFKKQKWIIRDSQFDWKCKVRHIIRLTQNWGWLNTYSKFCVLEFTHI